MIWEHWFQNSAEFGWNDPCFPKSFSGFFLLGGVPPPLHQTKMCSFLHQEKSGYNPMKTSFLTFSCSHCSCTIFILTSYFLYTQVMLLLILTDVQYLQKVVFSFEQGLNGQNNSSWITTSLSSLLVKQSCLLFSWPNHGSLLFCKHFFMLFSFGLLLSFS